MSKSSRPKTVCFVVSRLGVGGAEKNLYLLAANLPRDRFVPVVLSLGDEGPYAERLRASGVPVYSLGLPCPCSIWKAIRFFARCRVDLFHGFMFHGNIAARLLGAMFRKPSISAIRVAEGEKRWHLWMDRRTAGLVDVYTTNGRSLSAFVADRIGVPPERIRMISNALAVEDLTVSSNAGRVRKLLDIPEGAPLAAMIGRLHIQKDPETFVRAAKLVRAVEPRAHFLIAGIGPMQFRLQSLIAGLGLRGFFHLPGMVNAHDVYAACDLFVLSSLWEGVPNAAIEAMAAGRAAILSDFDGAADVVEPGMTGEIFPHGDANALAETMLTLFQDPDRRAALGTRAREAVTARYSVGQLVDGNVRLYEQLTAGRAAK